MEVKGTDSVAQLVEQYTFNVRVLGSNPSGITAKSPFLFYREGLFLYVPVGLPRTKPGVGCLNGAKVPAASCHRYRARGGRYWAAPGTRKAARSLRANGLAVIIIIAINTCTKYI